MLHSPVSFLRAFSLRRIAATLSVAAAVMMGCPRAAAARLDPSGLPDLLRELDSEIGNRNTYIKARANAIDQLKASRPQHPASEEEVDIFLNSQMALSEAYRAFHNDSAIQNFHFGAEIARRWGRDSLAMVFHLKEIALYPLSGFTVPAVAALRDVDRSGFSPRMEALYHESARQLFNFLAMMHPIGSVDRLRHERTALAHQDTLLTLLPPGDPQRAINLAENYMGHGEIAKARAASLDLLSKLSPASEEYARVAYLMHTISAERGEQKASTFFLALSALADIRSATLEVSSIQDLGQHMFELDDVKRAFNYLTLALQSAVESRSEMRIIQSGGALAMIEAANKAQNDRERQRTYMFMALMGILLIVVIGAMMILRKEMQRIESLRENLETANNTKDLYIGKFMQLCSIYMDKLNHLCQLANRKITAGKAEEFLKLTRSARFIEEQSSEFFEVFDNAFLHLYPDFPVKVNELLKPEERLPLPQEGHLSSDLRILALMRMGITDNGRIADFLGYSVNTIYAYRNKMRNRAADRGTFEDEVLSIE